jgi:hypothetical protein
VLSAIEACADALHATLQVAEDDVAVTGLCEERLYPAPKPSPGPLQPASDGRPGHLKESGELRLGQPLPVLELDQRLIVKVELPQRRRDDLLLLMRR